jgi:hypothetical protein
MMSNMKYHLTSQLMDLKLRARIMEKEDWSNMTFDKVDWSAFETDFKRLSRIGKRGSAKVATTCGTRGNEMSVFFKERNHVVSATWT